MISLWLLWVLPSFWCVALISQPVLIALIRNLSLGWSCALRQDALLPAHGLCLLWIHVCPPPSHLDLTWGPSQLGTTDLSRDQVHVTAAAKSPQLKDPASAHLPIKHGGSRNCHHRKGQESERSAEPPPTPGSFLIRKKRRSRRTKSWLLEAHP